jgi:RNA-directed DNA polymerase
MTWHKRPRLKIAPESRKRLAEKIRLALRGGHGQSMQQVINGLNPALQGWMAYFRLAEVKNVLEELDGWLRYKLRTLKGRQWKRVYTLARNLMKAGLAKVRGWKSATHGRGPLWNGGAPHYEPCLPQVLFRRHRAGFIAGYSSMLPVRFMNRRMPNGTSAWYGRTAGVIPPPTRSGKTCASLTRQRS